MWRPAAYATASFAPFVVSTFPLGMPQAGKQRFLHLHGPTSCASLPREIDTKDHGKRHGFRVAIIGAGAAGAACATRLLRKSQDHGALPLHLRIFDMGSRGPGGRASSRPVDGKGGSFSPQDKGGGAVPVGKQLMFDHGAQAISTSDPTVQALLDELVVRGDAEEWKGVFGVLDASTGSLLLSDNAASREEEFCDLVTCTRRFTGVPSMASLVSGLLEMLPDGKEGHRDSTTSVDYCWQTRVERPNYDHACKEGRWLVTSSDGESWYCDVVVCAGHAASFAAGAAAKLPLDYHKSVEIGSDTIPALLEVSYPDGVAPLYALMMALPKPLLGRNTFAGAIVRGSEDLIWISRDNSKPGRQSSDGRELWVALSSEKFAKRMKSRPSWSKRPTEDHLQEAAQELMQAFEAALHVDLPVPDYIHAQRWAAGFTRCPLALQPPRVSWPDVGLVACGDWCGKRAKMDEAILSGLSAADAAFNMAVDSKKMRQLISVQVFEGTPSLRDVEQWPVWSCAALPDPAGTFQESKWWESRIGAVEERCLITKGRATLLPQGGGNPVTIKEGDWVVFRKGFSCTWHVEEHISKHYNYYDANGNEWYGPRSMRTTVQLG